MRNLLCVSVLVSLSSACAGGRAETDTGRIRFDGGVPSDAPVGLDVAIPGDVGPLPDAWLGPSTDAGVDAATPPDARMPDAGPIGPCGAAGCAGWLLSRGAPTWTPIARPPGPFAPTSPVRAAFDIESLSIAYVLTDSNYHILRLSDRTYTGAGARADLFPQSTGALINAYSVTAGHAGGDPNIEGITVESVTSAQSYDFNLTTRGVAFTREITDFGAVWTGPRAPARSSIRAAWLALENDSGWVTGAPSSLCPGGASATTAYAGVISTATIHVVEAGQCFDFYAPVAYTAFTPFTRPGAPRVEDVAAAFYNRGDLWILAE